MEPMNQDDRRDNMLGAFVLSVCDRLRRETEEAIGHTGASAAALIMIAEFPDRTIEFLRQAIGLSHPATVRVVDRLVEQRLVRRRPAGAGPAVALTATAAGKRQARRILEIRQQVIRESLPELSPAESDTLVAVLERALAHLSATPGTTHCRLCDMKRCPRSDCPVIQKQIELGAPPPEPVPIPD
jgi:MarR family transcriptional regulator, negative regulator of the multidrug operon emrRAB